MVNKDEYIMSFCYRDE